MKHTIRTLVLLLLVLFATGCTPSGPFYRVNAAYLVEDQWQLIIEKFWLTLFWGVYPEGLSGTYHVATLRPCEKDAVTARNLDRLLASDGRGETSRIWPVRGTSKWVCVQSDIGIGGDTRITLLDPASPRSRRLATFPHGIVDPKGWAWALSPSGCHLLLVGPSNLDLWDLTTETRVTPEDLRPLQPLRTYLEAHRGSVGSWWLSNDLRQVIVLPSRDIQTRGGTSRGSEVMRTDVFNASIDVQRQGIIYDRIAKQATPFETELRHNQNRLPLVAILQKDQQPLFLFGDSDSKRLVLTEPDQTVVAAIDLQDGEADINFSSYDDHTGQVIFVGRDRHRDPNGGRAAEFRRDHFLFLWNVRTKVSKRINVADAMLRKTVEVDK